MMTPRYFRQGIVPPPSVLTITDAAKGDAPLDLTNATRVDASFYLRTNTGKTLVTGWPKQCTIQPPPTAGTVTVTWSSTDVAAVGTYEVQAVVTFGNGQEASTIQQTIVVQAVP